MISDEKWELKIFQVWTVPVEGRVKYNILVFQKVHKYSYIIILNVFLAILMKKSKNIQVTNFLLS